MGLIKVDFYLFILKIFFCSELNRLTNKNNVTEFFKKSETIEICEKRRIMNYLKHIQVVSFYKDLTLNVKLTLHLKKSILIKNTRNWKYRIIRVLQNETIVLNIH